jgi:hypothetical protein
MQSCSSHLTFLLLKNLYPCAPRPTSLATAIKTMTALTSAYVTIGRLSRHISTGLENMARKTHSTDFTINLGDASPAKV